MKVLESATRARCHQERRRTWDAAELAAWRSLFHGGPDGQVHGRGTSFVYVDRFPVRARTLEVLHQAAQLEDSYRAVVKALGLEWLL